MGQTEFIQRAPVHRPTEVAPVATHTAMPLPLVLRPQLADAAPGGDQQLVQPRVKIQQLVVHLFVVR